MKMRVATTTLFNRNRSYNYVEVAIPAAVMRASGIENGDKFSASLDGNRLLVTIDTEGEFRVAANGRIAINMEKAGIENMMVNVSERCQAELASDDTISITLGENYFKKRGWTFPESKRFVFPNENVKRANGV